MVLRQVVRNSGGVLGYVEGSEENDALDAAAVVAVCIRTLVLLPLCELLPGAMRQLRWQEGKGGIEARQVVRDCGGVLGCGCQKQRNERLSGRLGCGCRLHTARGISAHAPPVVRPLFALLAKVSLAISRLT
jgi:hypothetical protein